MICRSIWLICQGVDSAYLEFYVKAEIFQVRRLRFRRPRPKLIDVDNPDGDLRGSPVELRLAGNIQNALDYLRRLALLKSIN